MLIYLSDTVGFGELSRRYESESGLGISKAFDIKLAGNFCAELKIKLENIFQNYDVQYNVEYKEMSSNHRVSEVYIKV